MIARIVEGRGSKRTVTSVPLDTKKSDDMARGFCTYLGITAKR